jgi:molybdate transport system substrate-binding protein
MLRLLCALSLLAAPAAARDLHVLTGAGMAGPVRVLAADFGKQTGTDVSVTSDTTGGMRKRMEAGEKYDLVIGTTAVLDALTGEDLVVPQHHALARMVAGLCVKKGQPRPDLSDAAALRALLRKADSIAYVDPDRGGITGAFFLEQADKLGVGEHVRARAVLKADGASVADAVATGEAQYGVTLVSEMLPDKGVSVWPLPDAAQMTTIYAGALSGDTQNALDAARLLDTLTGEEGAKAARDAGLKPVSSFN